MKRTRMHKKSQQPSGYQKNINLTLKFRNHNQSVFSPFYIYKKDEIKTIIGTKEKLK